MSYYIICFNIITLNNNVFTLLSLENSNYEYPCEKVETLETCAKLGILHYNYNNY